jgi:uncharacterized protein YggE
MTTLRDYLLLGVMLGIPLMGHAETDNLRLITVSGKGEVNVNPDRASLTLGVESRSPVLDKARDEVNTTTNRFLAFAKTLDIKDKHISTTGANVRPEYNWDNKSRERNLIGYFVSRSLVVDLRDLDKLGRLVEGAVDLGVNQVSDPTLGLADQSGAEKEALKLAAEDARRNAEVLAKTLGVKVGQVRSVTATDMGYSPPKPAGGVRMMRAEAAQADGAASYSAGQVQFSTRVNAQFDIAE